MRLLPTFPALLLPVIAWAQSPFVEYKCGTQLRLTDTAELYKHLSDSTTARPDLLLRAGKRLVVLGHASTYWIVVRRKHLFTRYYYLRVRDNLFSYTTGQ
jgi:hypothetical protein